MSSQPDIVSATLNEARRHHQAEFTSTKHAPWRQDPAAVAGYAAGFDAGWHARDEEIARLQADLDRAFDRTS